MQCGNGADWNLALTIREWIKLIATAIAISVAMTAVGAGAVWLIAKEAVSVGGLDDGQKRKIAEFYAAGKTIPELAEEYGCGVGTIWRALQPETSEAA